MMFKKWAVLPVIALVMVLASCSPSNNEEQESEIVPGYYRLDAWEYNGAEQDIDGLDWDLYIYSNLYPNIDPEHPLKYWATSEMSALPRDSEPGWTAVNQVGLLGEGVYDTSPQYPFFVLARPTNVQLSGTYTSEGTFRPGYGDSERRDFFHTLEGTDREFIPATVATLADYDFSNDALVLEFSPDNAQNKWHEQETSFYSPKSPTDPLESATVTFRKEQ